jgi:hypothetical protein
LAVFSPWRRRDGESRIRSKASLLAAIATVGFEDLSAAMTVIAAKYPCDPAKQLMRLGSLMSYWRCAIPSRHSSCLAVISILRRLMGPYQASKRACDGLVQIVENRLRAGIYKERDARKLALCAWTIVPWLATLVIAGELTETAPSEKQIVDLVRYVCKTHQSGLLKA